MHIHLLNSHYLCFYVYTYVCYICLKTEWLFFLLIYMSKPLRFYIVLLCGNGLQGVELEKIMRLGLPDGISAWNLAPPYCLTTEGCPDTGTLCKSRRGLAGNPWCWHSDLQPLRKWESNVCIIRCPVVMFFYGSPCWGNYTLFVLAVREAEWIMVPVFKVSHLEQRVTFVLKP